MRAATQFARLAVALTCVCPLRAQPAPTPPAERFEVASIRISQAGGTLQTSRSEPGSANFTATNIPLRILIQMAYEADEPQILGLDSCGSEAYNVAATPEGGGALTPERLRPMLIALLAERFGLAAHRETKTVSGYALVPAKSPALAQQKLQVSDASREGQSAILRGRIIGRGAPLYLLAALLSRPLRAPVVDKTGIDGTYDIDLKFAPEDATDSALPSVFTAVEEQLGLKLESQKVPMELLVIDRCQRIPTDN